jgi:hypothetical protein
MEKECEFDLRNPSYLNSGFWNIGGDRDGEKWMN